MVWNQKKKILVDGPTFPIGFRNNLSGHFCSIALNRTHLILMLSFKGFSTLKMVVINFNAQIWHTFNNINEGHMEYCAGAAVEFDKNGQRYLSISTSTSVYPSVCLSFICLSICLCICLKSISNSCSCFTT